ncbi:Serine/threonine-protein kinase TOR [Capsicum baccatum]|uniref:Serine/threonine-protein kinase TOR n=1 Tax=Capsicum baccatum TaxID=33114 RepID=A0A2G2V9K0_CAPBA|nr:Serine/threonine-protein kinase TOR [Capsicum baccatum]
MGSSSQAIRYPVATTGAGNINALNRVLADLCTRSNPKVSRAFFCTGYLILILMWLVEEEARDLSGEAFARFMDHLYERITTFLYSNEVSENLGALRAIDELIDVTVSENASNVAKFSNYMRVACETKHDPEILVLASKVLGYLDRSCGAMTADEVERQVKVALEWLRGERIEYRLLAAVLILKICMNHILHVLKIPAECASGFIALGEMAGALDGELINYLPIVTSHLRDAIAPRRGRPSLEVLACVGNIAKAMGPTMEPHVRGLLDSMFSSGLSLTPVEALEQITERMVSISGKEELGSSSLSWGFDEKENESKVAKLKSPAKGSKNIMSDDFSFFQDYSIPEKENLGGKK